MTVDHAKNEFTVHANSGPMIFKEHKGLYVYQPSKRYLDFIAKKKAEERENDQTEGTRFLTADPEDLVNHAEESPTTGTSDEVRNDDDLAGVPEEKPTLFQDNSVPTEPLPMVLGVCTDRAELENFIQQVMSLSLIHI